MARWFVIPMQPPANAQRKGTVDDPWRPKYLKERGLGYTNSTNFRYWLLCEVLGPKEELDKLDLLPDVFELVPGKVLSQTKVNAMQVWLNKRGITNANLSLTGDTLAQELKRICYIVQQQETAQKRDTIFSDITGL